MRFCALLVLAVMSPACAAGPPPPSEKSPLLSGVLPGFSSETISGREFGMGEFHGRPFVVSLFESRCKGCDASLRATQAMYSDMHDVSVVGVFRGERAEALRLAREFELRFPIVADPGGEIARRLEVQEFPRTFVADRQGRVAWVGGATLTEDALASAVDAVR